MKKINYSNIVSGKVELEFGKQYELHRRYESRDYLGDKIQYDYIILSNKLNNKDKDEYVLEIETVDHEIMLRNLDTAKTLKDFYIYLTKMQIFLLQERYIFNKIYFNEFDFLIQNKIGFRILMSNFSQFDINNSLYSDIFNWMKQYLVGWDIKVSVHSLNLFLLDFSYHESNKILGEI